MEENTTVQAEQPTQAKNSNWKTIPTIITIIGVIYIVFTLFGGGSESKAIDAAEKHAKQSYYTVIGLVPENYKSEVIYKDGDKRLIEVKTALEGYEWDATYCVYANGEYVVNCTTMMGSGFDCKDNLEELKALFAL